MMRLLQAVGQNSLATVAGFGDFAIFVSRAVTAVPATRKLGRRWIRAVQEQGVRCVPVVTIVGLFAGLVLGLQGYYVLARFGSAGRAWHVCLPDSDARTRSGAWRPHDRRAGGLRHGSGDRYSSQ